MNQFFVEVKAKNGPTVSRKTLLQRMEQKRVGWENCG
jgi:hypothetical protein